MTAGEILERMSAREVADWQEVFAAEDEAAEERAMEARMRRRL